MVQGGWHPEALEVMDKTMAGESVYPDDVPTVDVGLAKALNSPRRRWKFSTTSLKARA